MSSSNLGFGALPPSPQPSETSAGLLVLPLISHHAALERRRSRQLGRQHEQFQNQQEQPEKKRQHERSQAQKHGIEEHRRRYRRRALSLRNSTHSQNMSHSSTPPPHTAALYQGYGTHYVDLWVGEPMPQRQTVIVDTGSGVTAFPCSDSDNSNGYFHDDTYRGNDENDHAHDDKRRAVSFGEHSIRRLDTNRNYDIENSDFGSRDYLDADSDSRNNTERRGVTSTKSQTLSLPQPHHRFRNLMTQSQLKRQLISSNDKAQQQYPFHTDSNYNAAKSTSFRPLACYDCMRGVCYTTDPDGWNTEWNRNWGDSDKNSNIDDLKSITGNNNENNNIKSEHTLGERCWISMNYQEGSSWKAFEARDWAYIGGFHHHTAVVFSAHKGHNDHVTSKGNGEGKRDLISSLASLKEFSGSGTGTDFTTINYSNNSDQTDSLSKWQSESKYLVSEKQDNETYSAVINNSSVPKESQSKQISPIPTKSTLHVPVASEQLSTYSSESPSHATKATSPPIMQELPPPPLDPSEAVHYAFPLTFGCQTSLNGLFITQLADGILGMDRTPSSYWRQMYDHGAGGAKIMAHKGFSLCYGKSQVALSLIFPLGNPSRPSKHGNKQNDFNKGTYTSLHDRMRSGLQAGILTLGGTDSRWHTSPMKFAWSGSWSEAGNNQDNKFDAGISGNNMSESERRFFVHLKGIYLLDERLSRDDFRMNNQIDKISITGATNSENRMHRLDISESRLNAGGVIIDSGTTDTYFLRQIAEPFQLLWRELVGESYHHNPRKLTKEQLLELPTIVFRMKGASTSRFDVNNSSSDGIEDNDEQNDTPPDDVFLYMTAANYMEYDYENDLYTPRFYVEETHGSVLGANAMMGHDVYFDVENQRIGWAESECVYDQWVVQGTDSDGRGDEQGSEANIVAGFGYDNAVASNEGVRPISYESQANDGHIGSAAGYFNNGEYDDEYAPNREFSLYEHSDSNYNDTIHYPSFIFMGTTFEFHPHRAIISTMILTFAALVAWLVPKASRRDDYDNFIRYEPVEMEITELHDVECHRDEEIGEEGDY